MAGTPERRRSSHPRARRSHAGIRTRTVEIFTKLKGEREPRVSSRVGVNSAARVGRRSHRAVYGAVIMRGEVRVSPVPAIMFAYLFNTKP